MGILLSWKSSGRKTCPFLWNQGYVLSILLAYLNWVHTLVKSVHRSGFEQQQQQKQDNKSMTFQELSSTKLIFSRTILFSLKVLLT